jgi:Fuc2NAc and GlcNAc transferase
MDIDRALNLLATCALPAAAATAALTAGLLPALRRAGLVDRPGHRSSHAAPTVTGAGIGFVAVASSGWAIIAGRTDAADLGPIASVAGCMAILGWADDRWSLPARLRLAAHALGATVVALAILGVPASPAAAAAVAGAGFLVAWSANAFNFMDGLDALAATESIAVATGGLMIAAVAGDPAGQGPTLSVLAGALAGFLPFNLPKARAFMGDAGSTWLGFSLAALAVASAARDPATLPAWLVLPALFVADSGVCGLRRLARGERMSQPHRSHAYQRLARRLGSHGKVVAAFAALNATVLCASWACMRFPSAAWWIFGTTYALAISLATAAGSGHVDPEERPLVAP